MTDLTMNSPPRGLHRPTDQTAGDRYPYEHASLGRTEHVETGTLWMFDIVALALATSLLLVPLAMGFVGGRGMM